jgi:sulfatase modifying factor 1
VTLVDVARAAAATATVTIALACGALVGIPDSATQIADASSTDGDGATRDAPVPDAGIEAGGDSSACVSGARRCSGTGVQTCGSGGQWGSSTPCADTTPLCSDGFCGSTTGQSCQSQGDGLTNCGMSSESCCTSIEVTGGTYYRTYANTGSGPTGMANPATVTGFRLDKYLVTVGRFREFVKAGGAPSSGSGKHSHLNGGRGLANSYSPGAYESGWLPSDDTNIAPTDANLACAPRNVTWTSSPSTNEKLPINCANWYEAYAFCIWDGGFLPSEAEWEYAAGAGSEQREYPWGAAQPGEANRYAIYNCLYPSSSGICTVGGSNIAPVGSALLGAGLWGQIDLAGELGEWNLDALVPNADSGAVQYVEPCVDCAGLGPSNARGIRGGDFAHTALYMLPATRNSGNPIYRGLEYGFRCARTP